MDDRAGAIVDETLVWYAANGRDLDWRRPGTSPWGVLVSEFMLQQTPVERVRGPWAEWLRRWPTPADLAAAAAGDAVRAWGRLGYPRRALRLHESATVITECFGGHVPAAVEDLLGLPGVGRYTAAAVASFAYGERAAVVDTNVRRVLARAVTGAAHAQPSATAAEWALAESVLPAEPERARRWAVASMELGAVVCRARTPLCHACPITDLCAWQRAGRPAWSGPRRAPQRYDGTDRQCRGALLAELRSSDRPVPAARLLATWPDRVQATRALDSLVVDGLVVAIADHYGLPGIE